MKKRSDDRLVVWGAGSWGTALAIHLAGSYGEVAVWVYDRGQYETMSELRANPDFLPGKELPGNITLFHDPGSFPSGASVWLSVTPTQYLRPLWSSIGPRCEEATVIVSASKGIENNTLMLPSEIISSFAGGKKIVALSGPSFARDFMNGDPTAVVLASEDENLAKYAQERFSYDNLRGYLSRDRKGVELGGALKNVMAIAAGIAAGLGFGPNAVAAIITRGIVEISRLGGIMGCHGSTFSGLSGLGDLVLTCYGEESRNRSLGIRLGRGEKLSDIVASTKMVAEGPATTLSLAELLKRHKVDMPISYAVYSILYEEVPPKKALEKLLSRSLKWENG